MGGERGGGGGGGYLGELGLHNPEFSDENGSYHSKKKRIYQEWVVYFLFKRRSIKCTLVKVATDSNGTTQSRWVLLSL